MMVLLDIVMLWSKKVINSLFTASKAKVMLFLQNKISFQLNKQNDIFNNDSDVNWEVLGD